MRRQTHEATLRRTSLRGAVSSVSAAHAWLFTLSLHDALPILHDRFSAGHGVVVHVGVEKGKAPDMHQDRKSTRLNSSHRCTSYAVFCLKKKSAVLGLGVGERVGTDRGQRHVRGGRPGAEEQPR